MRRRLKRRVERAWRALDPYAWIATADLGLERALQWNGPEPAEQ